MLRTVSHSAWHVHFYHSSLALTRMGSHSLRDIAYMTSTLICNGRDKSSVAHEVLDTGQDLGSGGMLAAADRTPASEERLVPHGAQSIRRAQERVRGTVE